MKVTILDTVTGQRVVVDSPFGAFWWAEGNGACDCNRRDAFGHPDPQDQRPPNPEKPWQRTCAGCERYLIVHADTDEYTIEQMNSDYPDLLKARR